MNKDTFEVQKNEAEKKQSFTKERYEWISSWCDNTNDHDLPRVLLIGDSIVRSYEGTVRNSLAGVAYVDYISTSYALDNPIYKTIILDMAKNSSYDLILFNFGLHGGHLSIRSYRSRYAKILTALMKLSRVIPITTTNVYKSGSKRLNPFWRKKCIARNEAVYALAKEHDLAVCDLAKRCEEIPFELRSGDGCHFAPDGAAMLAETVVAVIKENLSSSC